MCHEFNETILEDEGGRVNKTPSSKKVRTLRMVFGNIGLMSAGYYRMKKITPAMMAIAPNV